MEVGVAKEEKRHHLLGIASRSGRKFPRQQLHQQQRKLLSETTTRGAAASTATTTTSAAAAAAVNSKLAPPPPPPLVLPPSAATAEKLSAKNRRVKTLKKLFCDFTSSSLFLRPLFYAPISCPSRTGHPPRLLSSTPEVRNRTKKARALKCLCTLILFCLFSFFERWNATDRPTSSKLVSSIQSLAHRCCCPVFLNSKTQDSR